MKFTGVFINTGSQYFCVNGAIIVNTFYETGFCMLLKEKLASIYLLILVNRHTPSFPVELSKRRYEMLTDSFTLSID